MATTIAMVSDNELAAMSGQRSGCNLDPVRKANALAFSGRAR
jgi:hypothetical protein